MRVSFLIFMVGKNEIEYEKNTDNNSFISATYIDNKIYSK
ncbi:hypothetical protein J498_3010 [Acinetobacter baumannii 781407]|nr:hypothetical protein CSB70_0881 [Acinetobacter baumannii]AVI36326.1 hypothetical protein CSB68_2343 [Acinetobacter baumannii]EJP40758.1 hypothetical protein ACIN5032_1033 [Acinetobacter baumannii OIFC032]EKP40404.1 hypothetical protein ACIN5099_1245 [Acinetobacter baumannii OIFC099]EXD52254.1 hypothetical protein J498_3010 [Acinetobacter baumannii 781407]